MDTAELLERVAAILGPLLSSRAAVSVDPPSDRWKVARLRVTPRNPAAATIEAWEDADSLLFTVGDNYGPRLEWGDDVCERAVSIVIDIADNGYEHRVARFLPRRGRSWPPY